MIYFTKTIYGEKVVLCGNRFIVKDGRFFVVHDAYNIKSITHIEKALCPVISFYETLLELLKDIDMDNSHDDILQYLT